MSHDGTLRRARIMMVVMQTTNKKYVVICLQ